jgi:hypothetical protein
MRSRIAFALVLLAVLAGVGAAGQADAAPATAVAVYHVPPITCERVDACDQAYNANGSLPGYWMARRFDHPGLWIRTTKVAGWDNTYAAPITCPTEDSCVIAYYSPGSYWIIRQAEGTTWVRTSMIPSVGAKRAGP